MIFNQNILKEAPEPEVTWTHVTVVMVSLGLACFFASLFQTAFFTSGEDIQGFWVLLIGWIGLVIFQFAWFANPLNLLALLLLKQRPYVSLFLSGIALLLATQTFLFFEIPVGLQNSKVYIKELGLGFYLWYLSQAIFLMAIITEVIKKERADY